MGSSYVSFENNTSSVGGGAFVNTGVAVVDTCLFDSNTANLQNGGGINNSGDLQVTNTTFGDNIAQTGGSIYTSADSAHTVTITNCDFGSGLALYGGAIGSSNTAVYSVQKCWFNLVTGETEGGVIAANGTVSISDSLFVGNTGDHDGGVIAVRSGTTTIERSIIYENTSYFNNSGILVDAGCVRYREQHDNHRQHVRLERHVARLRRLGAWRRQSLSQQLGDPRQPARARWQRRPARRRSLC